MKSSKDFWVDISSLESFMVVSCLSGWIVATCLSNKHLVLRLVFVLKSLGKPNKIPKKTFRNILRTHFAKAVSDFIEKREGKHSLLTKICLRRKSTWKGEPSKLGLPASYSEWLRRRHIYWLFCQKLTLGTFYKISYN